uniref:TLC domain-containing protein n=1 Tax=Heterorhabditis bacteriophora TaxID=37862 RepID=A0A1I7XW27_HETBA
MSLSEELERLSGEKTSKKEFNGWRISTASPSMLNRRARLVSKDGRTLLNNVELPARFRAAYRMESQHTIGYGFRYMTDLCPPAYTTLCFQLVVGVFLQTMLAGIIVAKVLRPKKRKQEMRFSRMAVIGPLDEHDKRPALMIRLADIQEKLFLAESHVRLYMASSRINSRGDRELIGVKDMNVGYDSGWDRVLLLWRWDWSTKMNSTYYQDVLGHYLFLYLQRFPGVSFTFQQNNATISASRITKTRLKYNDVDTMNWLSRCPDRNLVTNLWEILMRRIHVANCHFNTQADFELIMTVEGIVEATGMTFQARTSFLPEEILWGHKFKPMILMNEKLSKYEVHYAMFDQTERVFDFKLFATETEETEDEQMHHNNASGFICNYYCYIILQWEKARHISYELTFFSTEKTIKILLMGGLWDESFWLPEKVSWTDMKSNSTITYPEVSDLWYTVIIGLGMLNRPEYCLLSTHNSNMTWLIILRNEPHLIDVKECWRNWPHHHVSNEIWWYYIIEASFYWALFVGTLCIDIRRADFMQMMVHHAITILLLYISWSMNMTRVGTLVLFIHDAADIFIEAGKIFRYAHWNFALYVLFVTFLIVWTITRLIYYPFWIIRSVWFDAPMLIQSSYRWSNIWQRPLVPRILMIMLSLLLVLHIFWTYVILKVRSSTLFSKPHILNKYVLNVFSVAYKSVREGDVSDVREDSDFEEEDIAKKQQ